LAIQRRENDLVGASFGRGFFILDDYSALRTVSSTQIAQAATLFTPRKAWWYVPRSAVDFDDIRGSQGSQLYVAPNPDFGAVFTYYLKDEFMSQAKMRMEREKSISGDVPFGGWEAMAAEKNEEGPFVFLEVKDKDGKVVNRVLATNKKGFNRVAWNLRVASKEVMRLNGGYGDANGLMVAPGVYSAQLHSFVNGNITPLAEAVSVDVVPMYEGSLEGAAKADVAAFWRAYESLSQDVSKLDIQLGNTEKTVDKLLWAGSRTNIGHDEITRISTLKQDVAGIREQVSGNVAKNEIGERNRPTIGDRLFAVNRGITLSTYGPTPTHKQSMTIIEDQLSSLNKSLEAVNVRITDLAKIVLDAGGPWIEGQK
jgi:hypothetical protein